jgi:tRNA-2-methylthio-N6-dimethylallyladenosine synthase
MNVYDALRMGEMLEPHGYTMVHAPDDADLVIYNTCHIRDKADEKVFSDVGRFKVLAKPNAIHAVGGCVGQAMGKKVIDRSPAISVVFGPQTYHRLPEFIEIAERRQPFKGRTAVVDTDFPELEKFDTLPKPGAYGPTAFLTIQEGCDKFCTYCVVPYTRGAELSRAVEQVLEEAEGLVAQGVKELCLLGQNVNAYHGTDVNGKEVSFAELIKRLCAIDGMERLRFTTSHTNNMKADLLELFANEPKLMPYLHLPVQSGSNRILQAMNRNHTREDYLDVIKAVRKVRPDIAISGDFIVGFPGETEEDYQETLKIVAETNYAIAYSFAYSQRPGTPAAVMDNQVPEDVKKERLAGLQALLNDQQEQFLANCMGKELDVLVEEKGRKDGELKGRTPHNMSVSFSGNERLIGQVVRVRITHTLPHSLQGEVVLAA